MYRVKRKNKAISGEKMYHLDFTQESNTEYFIIKKRDCIMAVSQFNGVYGKLDILFGLSNK